MSPKFLTYILFPVALLLLLLSSCDGDENLSSRSVEGHWTYSKTQINISVSDPSIKKIVDEYIAQNVDTSYTSYEFKNDRTYYYYVNYAEPLRGKFKMIDKDYATLDDSRGLRKLIREDSLIYVQYDLRKVIAEQLNISEDKLFEVTVTEIFERGLNSSSE